MSLYNQLSIKIIKGTVKTSVELDQLETHTHLIYNYVYQTWTGFNQRNLREQLLNIFQLRLVRLFQNRLAVEFDYWCNMLLNNQRERIVFFFESITEVYLNSMLTITIKPNNQSSLNCLTNNHSSKSIFDPSTQFSVNF